ncbi:MAG TPA: hypothetical protein VD963_00275 [Phycisphaerales bacterium]|nr:hypothetical protein [Phycisphaerales bacterium]
MPRTGTDLGVALWLDPGQLPLVRGVLERSGVRAAGVGTPARGRAAELAEALGAPPLDDLRSVLATTTAPALWLAAVGGFGADPADLEAVRAARARGVRVCTLEPLPTSAIQLAGRVSAGVAIGPGGLPEPEVLTAAAEFVPLFRHAPAHAELTELLPEAGRLRTLTARCLGAPEHGTLGARLFDALDLAVGLLGEPEAVDAAYVPPVSRLAGGLRLLPGDSLHGLRGDMTLNLRYATGASACLLASDQAVRWERSALLLADGGRLSFGDGGLSCAWLGRDLEEAPRRRRVGRDDPATVLAQALTRALGRDAAGPRPDLGAVLAVAGAALLSARTGENEAPATIRRMAGL